jgi:hypothetical protein
VQAVGGPSIGGDLVNATSNSPFPGGPLVAFVSSAINLVPDDTNGVGDIFVRTPGFSPTRVSVSSSGAQANNASHSPAVARDGLFVVFQSFASNLVPGDTNGFEDTFVYDRAARSTTRVNVSSSGEQANSEPGRTLQEQKAGVPSVGGSSSQGVAFSSFASNLVPGDTNGKLDVFVRDRQGGTTRRISVSSAGVQGNGDSYGAKITANGRYVTFTSEATNLVPGDTNGVSDVFIHDLTLATTTRVSVSENGAQGNGPSNTSGRNTGMYPNGNAVMFESLASNLVSGDTNGLRDVFVRTLCP